MGGAERMSINTGEELLKRGIDVYYILQQPIFQIPHNIPQERITVLRNKTNESTTDKLRALFWGVFRASRRIKPDVVLAFSRFSSFLACFTFNKNIIGRFDMNPYTLSKKQHLWANFVLNLPYVKKVVVPSTGMLEALRKEKPRFFKKFEIIPNSIKQKEVIEKSQTGSTDIYNFPYISAMGRLSPQKNFELLIEGYAKSKIRNKMNLVIIGDGRSSKKLHELVKLYSLEEKVIFTGRLVNPYPVIAGSVFFINTSSRESFCNVILEALALKKPVIATDCEYGPADMVSDEHNGYLIENNNLDQLILSLNKMDNISEIKLNEFSKMAEETANRFSINKIGEKWMGLIARVHRN